MRLAAGPAAKARSRFSVTFWVIAPALASIEWSAPELPSPLASSASTQRMVPLANTPAPLGTV